MDGLDLFRKLGVGAKFNFSRFKTDAEKLRIIKPHKAKENWKIVDDTVSEDVQDGNPQEDNKTRKRKRSLEEPDEEGSDPGNCQKSAVYLLGQMQSTDMESTTVETRKKRKKKRPSKKNEELLNAEVKQEKVNHFRNQHRIHVYGSDIADPVVTFDELETRYNMQRTIISNVTALGFDKPTPIQMQAIPVMMHGREILACAPTGSGKTMAFVLPILFQLKEPMNKGFRAVVLAPTRELAQQTHREFVRLAEGTGFRIHFIDKVGKIAKKFGPKSSQKCDILVTTPNKLVYMMKQDPPMISLKNVEWLIVDESDKLFEEGTSGFRDQLATIYKACDSSNARRAMFSATFAYEVEEWCKLNLDNVVQVYIGAKNSATETVKQELQFVGSETGKLIAVRNLVKKGIQPPILVFVQSKDRAKELFHELIYDGINVEVIHADRTKLQRENIVKQFRAGKIWILICTELMGRGIDFKGINLVINFDFPTSAISYIHRIGRTGRAGRPGTAVTFFTEDDGVHLRSIANVMKGAGCPVPDYMLKLKKPDKNEKRKLAKSAPKRDSISTVLKHNRGKKHQKPAKTPKSKSKLKKDVKKVKK